MIWLYTHTLALRYACAFSVQIGVPVGRLGKDFLREMFCVDVSRLVSRSLGKYLGI